MAVATKIDSLASTKEKKAGFYYDEAAAQRAVDFFYLFLKHIKGEFAGHPFKLLDWQESKIIRPLFGWKRADGTRKYRRCYVEIPRKSGKSTLCAGIGLYLTFADNEPGSEVYSAASDRDQAAIVFDVAKEMVFNDEKLRGMAQVFRRSIVVSKTSSFYKVLSADAFSKHGLNAHGIIFDELHAQPNRELWDVLTTSTGARRQPIIIAITTAGFDRHSICWEMHDYATKVRDKIIDDPEFLQVIYAAPMESDWREESTWVAANPGIGITVKRDYLAAECKRAIETPGYQNTFRRLHLNQWVEQETRWLDMVSWDENGGKFTEEELEGRSCFAGLDLSTTTDITALILLFPPAGDDLKWRLLCRFWVPAEGIVKRAERDRVPYDVWQRQGFIEATEGNVVDYDVIRERVKQLAERFRIIEIAYDRWNSSQLITQLQNDGAQVVPIGQGYVSLSAPTKEMEKLILGRLLAHGDNPVLKWMASNVATEQDAAGNIKPSKKKSTERIDGIVAVVMALARAIAYNADGERSIYEQREIFSLG